MSDRFMPLSAIETRAHWLRYYAEGLGQFVAIIDEMPKYDTRAEDQLEKAENTLNEVLLAVKLARSGLARKRPVSVAAE